jgi:hypothetical protein
MWIVREGGKTCHLQTWSSLPVLRLEQYDWVKPMARAGLMDDRNTKTAKKPRSVEAYLCSMVMGV